MHATTVDVTSIIRKEHVRYVTYNRVRFKCRWKCFRTFPKWIYAFGLVEFEKSFVSDSMCTLYLHVFVYVTAVARTNSMEDGTPSSPEM